MFVQPDEKAYTLNEARAMFEHRALWLYYLAENPANEGGDGPLHKAIRKCGLYHAAVKFGKFETIEKFNELFTAEPVRSVFEMEIVEKTDEKLSVDFHYCPLVEAWKKVGASDEDIAALCDIAMEGDRGIIEGIGGTKFELSKTIANGDDVCQIRISTL